MTKASVKFREQNVLRERIRIVLQSNVMGGGHVMMDSMHEFGGKHVILYRVETSAYTHNRVAVLHKDTLCIENCVIASQEEGGARG